MFVAAPLASSVKNAPAPQELLSTIEMVLHQEPPPDGELKAALPAPSDDKLTLRPGEVLRLIAGGCTAKEIALELKDLRSYGGVSPRRHHVAPRHSFNSVNGGLRDRRGLGLRKSKRYPEPGRSFRGTAARQTALRIGG